MAPLYSFHVGEQITAAQLLGEEDDTIEAGSAAAEAAVVRLEEILRKRKERA